MENDSITPFKICGTLPDGPFRDAAFSVLAEAPLLTLGEFWSATLAMLGGETAEQAAELKREATELRAHIMALRTVIDDNFKDLISHAEEALLQVDLRAGDLDAISKDFLSQAELIKKPKN